MSACKFPEHHSSGRGGDALLAVVTACIVAAVVLAALHAVLAVVAWLVSIAWLALFPVGAGVALLAYRPLLFAWHLARAGRSGLRYALPATWAGLRWRWVARNCQLAHIDHHRRRAFRPRLPFTTAVRVNPETKPLERWPAARFRVHEHGWTARVRTIPKVGREELSGAAPWIRDAWRCERVMVTQTRAGRVDIRACAAISWPSCTRWLRPRPSPRRLRRHRQHRGPGPVERVRAGQPRPPGDHLEQGPAQAPGRREAHR